MTTDIVRRDDTTSTIEMAKLMADSTLLPAAYRKQPANLLFAFEYADTIGIPRINALTSIHVIDGKPTASADLIAALVRRAGHKLRIEGDDTYCEAVIIRADDPGYIPSPVRWDEAKAAKAGLWDRGTWKKYPAAMLRSRAITEAARTWASDALYGMIYTPEELGAQVDADGAPVARPAAAAPAAAVADDDGDHYTPPSLSDRLKAKATDGHTVADAKQRLLAAVDGDRDRAVTLWNDAEIDGPVVTPEQLADLLAAAVEDDTVDAEVIEPEPADDEPADLFDDVAPDTPDEADTGEAMTKAQSGKLHALLRAKYDAVGPARFPILSDALSRDVTSTSDITKAEASFLIDVLDAVEPGAAVAS